jgi:hypothetical protein
MNLTEMNKEFSESKNVETHFIIPLQKLLLSLKLVEKDDRKIPTPYIKMEIFVPPEVGKSIKEVLSSDWSLALLGVKYKKEPEKKE